MNSSGSNDRDTIVVDGIHGAIRLSDLERRVIDTGSFQRLRHLKQLQMGHVTYPNATHTRFAHCLGTLAIMQRVLAVADLPSLTPEEKADLRLAALLHDVGHYPYSHLMERVEDARLAEEFVGQEGRRTLDRSRPPYPNHDTVGRYIVTGQQDLLEAIGSPDRAERVADIFTRTHVTGADVQLSKLIHSSLDLDRLDYLLRDSQSAGVPYGNIDINYLLNSLRISGSGMLGVAEKALPAAEHCLFARFFMHQTVYYHKTTFGLEEACRQLLKRLRSARALGIPEDGRAIRKLVESDKLRTFTDAYVDEIVRKAALGEGLEAASAVEQQVIQVLARAILRRTPPKLLREVSVLKTRGDQAHAGTIFFNNCKHQLPSLAGASGIPLGQFLICQTRPLTLEERGGRMTAEEARGMGPEKEDELIKVFQGDDPEPKSLVDIENTFASVCADRFYQAYRLYVVYEGDDREAKMEELQTHTEPWTRAE